MSTLTGTGAMVRLVLRRDRIRLPVWVLAIAALLLSSVFSVISLYATSAQRQAYTAAVGESPVAKMMGGPGAGLPSMGAIVVFEISVTGYVALGLMSLLLTVRHTRAEEEAGRTDLLRAGTVGRHAGPAAALVVVAAANVVIGALVVAGMVAAGLAVTGSIALGASFVVFGLAMAGIAALAAQATEHSRGASGLAAAALGMFFVVRAAGDVGAGGLLPWTSPMGWALAVRPFADERWAVLLLPVALTAASTISALVLMDRRDIGSGLVPARPGPATGSRWLSGPLGLAVRQHRAAVAGWGTGLLLLGAAYGSVGDTVEDLVADNPDLAEFFAASGVDIVDSFFAVAASFMALVGAGFALQVAVRMRGEETAGRLEALLGAAVPRWRWAVSHLLVAAVGSAAVLGLAGLGLGLAHAALTGDGSQVGRLTAAALVYVPAVWTLIAVVTALFGLLPRAVGLAWGLLAGYAFLVLLGEPLRLPDWVMDLSPFHHTPPVPAQPWSASPLLAMLAASAVLVAGGLVALDRRDVGQA